MPLMHSYFDLHKKKWNKQNMPSKFNDPNVCGFYMGLVKDLSSSDILELSVLYLNNDIIAMHYGFVYNNRYYWYTPTHNYQYEKYSPGKLLVAELVKTSIERKINVFDFLRGNEKYKYFWTDKEIKLFSSLMISNNIISRFKFFVSFQLKRVILATNFGKWLRVLKLHFKELHG